MLHYVFLERTSGEGDDDLSFVSIGFCLAQAFGESVSDE